MDDAGELSVRSIGDRLRRLGLAVWVAAFLGACANHLHDFAVGGPRPYAGAPPAVEAFWTSLAAVDPVVAGLLLWRRRAGLLAGAALMVGDVAVNVTTAFSGAHAIWPSLLLQTAFLGYAVGSLPWLWPPRAAAVG